MIYVMGVPLLTEVETVISDVRSALESSGSELLARTKKSGDSLQVPCPFHSEGKEKHPSCGILLRDKSDYSGREIPAGTFHCFTCGQSGSLQELISFVFGYSDAGMYGYKWLVSHYCSVEVSKREPLKVFLGPKTQAAEEAISEEELSRYRFYHPYMWQRKLTQRVVDYFDVGYDAFSSSLTFPVKDLFGDVKYIQRRSVSGKFFNFGLDSHKGNYIYGLYEASLNPDKKILITESPIDALTAWTRGYAGVATCGLPITTNQLDLLANYSAREYIVATDDDFAGMLAAAFLKKRLNKVLWRMLFNGKKDLNDMTDEDWEKFSVSLL